MDHSRHLNIVEFLADMLARGERLELVDGQLHYRTPGADPQQHYLQILREHKDRLVDWLTEQAERPRIYPVCAGQQGLWMAWRLDPQTPIYNLFLVARLRDDLDLDALQSALQWLLDRHPTLRTRYPLADNEQNPVPMQQVEDGLRIDLPVRNEPDWTPAQIAGWIAREADRPFDLIHGPVMRTTVLCTGSGQRLLHWTLHHIASDFLTQEILIQDLEALYRAARSGATSPPREAGSPTESLRYRDFVRWEQDNLAAQGEHLRAYWQGVVDQWPPAPALPTDLAPVDDGNHAYRPATLDFDIQPDLAGALRAFCRNHQLSLFTLLLAAFQVVVGRFSGTQRFVIATPTSVRHLAGWQYTAGYLINPLCIVADLGGDPSMAQLLERTRQQLADGFEHQLFPYSEVLRLLQVKAGAGGGTGAAEAPSVGFILDTAHQPARAPSLFSETVAIGQRGTPEALSLSVFDMAGALSGQVTYDASRLLPDSIRRLVGCLQTLLCETIADPDRPISAMPLLSPEQRTMVLERWAAPPDPKANASAELGGLYRQFARQVAATPEGIALIACAEAQSDRTDNEKAMAERSISYRELDILADHVARRLSGAGAGPGSLVGVLLERSIGMVAGLLGILKLGAAYLPLDPAYPTQRLEYMLSDSGAALLLTDDALLSRLPSTHSTLIRLADCMAKAENAADPLTAATVRPDDIAYVIYTSGSTGQPKGIEATHGATENRLDWMWRTQPFDADDVCVHKTALSFVDSVWEIFGPLLRGVPSVILPEWLVQDIPRLIETLARYRVTRIVLVPSLLRALLDAELDAGRGLGDRLALLRHWVCSGETLPLELVQGFQAALPQARLINLYGSSEVAADVTWYDATALAESDAPPPARVPIGQPIDNVRCYILDAQLQPVAPGIIGELYIGGGCLARGYRGRQELTRERFIANPFAPGRLFRTGDRARWRPIAEAVGQDIQAEPEHRPDIEYLGRRDSQVKLRGFRIELGEIEAGLRAHPAVDDAVVLLAQHPSGARLVGYIAAPTRPSPGDLHQFLARSLPGYMLPGGFVLLDRLPLTPNGKVDRQALSGLTPAEPTPERAPEPPTSELEQTLAAIWAEVLGRNRIGRDDDFFLLGGHSLLATRITTRIHGQLGIDLPLRNLFDHPTIAALAQDIEARQLNAVLGEPGSADSDEIDLLL
ncbi:MAG: non-ribosomal peptide synthase [Thiohalocapsa sp. PB-PSB1]|nr:MAG: hypothetical protein N838_01685 [Thiohalocapsa sp. PB-PSB1]QQO55895.1 MAG: non-ribosomal peptide synthase [Thiohalocapsa sp. PB-PSB1]HCS92681.1 non-ribosomal peptide synthase [Chromatiaceae bacterium]